MKTRLGRRKGVGGGTRLQPEGFQYTTRDRLSSPNWLCRKAMLESRCCSCQRKTPNTSVLGKNTIKREPQLA